MVGSPLRGRVLIVDDVITAGTAVREVMALIEAAGAEVAGVVVALDRQEKGQGELSAIQEIAANYNIPVVSIITLGEVIDYLDGQNSHELREYLPQLQAYRRDYGIA